MEMILVHHGTKYRCSTHDVKSIAIALDFEGPQPNHFGTVKATDSVLKLGGFVGDTSAGGSCNVKTLSMIPHCNGTHTETVSHIVNEDIWIGHSGVAAMSVALLVTVTPELAVGVEEGYRPGLQDSNRVITASAIGKAIRQSLRTASGGALEFEKVRPDSLIVRTLPNTIAKSSRVYSGDDPPAFFTVEAIEEINRLKIRNLLVDLPSVDRMHDDGFLTNHHVFWNVSENTHQLSPETFQEKTITEMIYVDESVNDGLYILNLQVPAFCSDAAPSRPVIFAARRLE